jgi:hypothetical protein
VARGAADDDARTAVDVQRADEVLGAASPAASGRVRRIAPEHVAQQASDRVSVEMDHVTFLRSVPF